MKKSLIISPFSRRTVDGEVSPKDYPYWEEFINILNKTYHTTQIGLRGDKEIGCNRILLNLDFNSLADATSDVAWISVDNFLPHLINASHKNPGIVIFGISNPKLFGYDYNQNIIKSNLYLRKNQFEYYKKSDYNIDAFYTPEQLFNLINIK